MKKRGAKQKTERRDVHIGTLEAILERAATGALVAEDVETLRAAVDTLAVLTRELEAKGVSIARLRKLIFGASTEKTSNVVGDAPPAEEDEAQGDSRKKKRSKKRKGHGRNGAKAYRGAEKVPVAHAKLRHKDPCPDCGDGKIYRMAEPAVLIRIRGVAPLYAKLYELERFRCNLCGKVFTADAPPGTGDEKYDATSAVMIALMKYGCGLPFNRLERLEGSLGIPLPASTQWEVVARAAAALRPVFDELLRQAAQGEVIHNDDTTMKILELDPQSLKEVLSEDNNAAADAPSTCPDPEALERESAEEKDAVPDGRSGVFTSGIVSISDDRRIALFLTGWRHAGENLGKVLAKRVAELSPPIQMCDALSRNTAGDFASILANCNAHARRRFVDVAENFPDEVRYVLEVFEEVYAHDAEAKEQGMSAKERLRFHQVNSGPLMGKLKRWLREQIIKRKVEPNSGLGEAIGYMQTHWRKLILFLRVPGAPLDNNICERALKKAILHRKNAYFYKTENGARVGDLFMSLIHTAELNGIAAFEYLVALQQHASAAASNPAAWMPWTYHETLARSADAPSVG